jgi:hypothetical protein
MCNQRDRLIGYVYEEGAAAERDDVRRHLEACVECRGEVAALRSARADLLAWDVPAHESVWKPFAPASTRSWWQQVPVWARAAAAGLVLAAGAAGGAAVQAVAPQTGVPAGATVVSADDLSAAEQRILNQLRAEWAGLQSQTSAPDLAAVEARILASMRDTTHDELVTELERLRGQNSDYVEALARIYANMHQVRLASDLKYASLETKIDNLMAAVGHPGQPQ